MREKVVRVTDISREEWLEYRRSGIGGSDASTIVGLNPYSSLYYLYNDKLGLLSEKPDSEAMRQGRDLEQYVADRWMEATGKTCRRNNYMWRSAEHPCMLADIDREVVGENAGLECKTTSVYNRHDFEQGDIPPTYYVQCMHYMAVMGFDRMYLAVLVLNTGFYHFVIERDEEEIAALVEREEAFWRDHIQTQTPPDPDGSAATQSALRQLYPRERPEEYTLPLYSDADRILNSIEQLQNNVKELQALIDEKKAGLMAQMEDAPLAESPRYTCSWRTYSRTVIDKKRLEREQPEIFAAYAQTSCSRTFRFNRKKEETA